MFPGKIFYFMYKVLKYYKYMYVFLFIDNPPDPVAIQEFLSMMIDTSASSRPASPDVPSSSVQQSDGDKG